MVNIANSSGPRNAVEFFQGVGKLDEEPIRFYQYQKSLLKSKSRFLLVNKSRQVGISWALGAMALYRAMFYPRTRWGYLSAGERQGIEWLEEVRTLWEELPPRWRLPLKTDKKTKLAFKGGGRIAIFPANSSTVRSGKWTDIMLDEFAHVRDDAAILKAALPKISRSKSGGLYIVSTPLGRRGMFYDLWRDEELYPQLSRVEIPWQMCPDLDEEIIAFSRATLGTEGFAQEYECSFLDETSTYYPFELFLSNRSDIEVYSFSPGQEERNRWPADIHDPHWTTKVSELAAEIREACPALLDGGPLYGGFDVGRIRDTSEIYLVGDEGGSYPERFRVTLDRVSFTRQRFFLAALLEALPIEMMCVDQTGIGRDIAEYLSFQYPEQIEPFNFTAASKEELCTDAKQVLQDRRAPVDYDRSLMLQAHTIKRRIGTNNVLFHVDKAEAKGHHADRFWAWTLALRAAMKGTGYQPATVTVKLLGA